MLIWYQICIIFDIFIKFSKFDIFFWYLIFFFFKYQAWFDIKFNLIFDIWYSKISTWYQLFGKKKNQMDYQTWFDIYQIQLDIWYFFEIISNQISNLNRLDIKYQMWFDIMKYIVSNIKSIVIFHWLGCKIFILRYMIDVKIEIWHQNSSS